MTKSPTYTPEKRNISELLTLTNPPLVVPNWQRSYSWKSQHVETFWLDLMRSIDRDISEYFIGSIVIVNSKAGEYLLLDGQQRMATSAILLSVIRDFLKRHNASAASDLHRKYLSDFDYDTERTTYKISLNHYDREFFRRLILTEKTDGYSDPAPEHASHHLIIKARDYFASKFEEAWSVGDNKKAYTWSLSVQKKLLRDFTLISVVSVDEDTAAEVFETLNDRGIGLSTPDLLKNLLMRRAKVDSHASLIDSWSKILDFENETQISNFIRHYWISNHGDVKTQSLYREIKSEIEISDIDSVTFTDGLADSSDLYREIISGSYNEAGCGELIDDFREFGASANLMLPSIMAILESDKDEKKEAGLRLLIDLYVRYSIIGQFENSKLENVLYLAARDFRASGDFNAFSKSLRDAAPTDDQFKAAFATAIITKSRVQRYLLRKLETARRTTEELKVSTPDKVHVEHIYPQTPEDGKRWKDHHRWINRIGNLTLLCKSLNTKIKNAEFSKKKPDLAKSDILLTQDAAAEADWTPDIVATRQVKFSEAAVTIWSFGDS